MGILILLVCLTLFVIFIVGKQISHGTQKKLMNVEQNSKIHSSKHPNMLGSEGNLFIEAMQTISHYESLKPEKRELMVEEIRNAISQLESVIANDPKVEDAYFPLARTYFRLSEYDKALDICNRIINENEKDLDQAWMLKAFIKGDRDDYFQAVECFDKAISINPGFETFRSKGIFHIKREEYDESARCLKNALKFKPDSLFELYHYGVCLDEMGQYENAIEIFDTVTNCHPKYYRAWWAKGNILSQLCRYEEAVEAYNGAISSNPDFRLAWNAKGKILVKLNRYDEAAFCFDEVFARKDFIVPAYPYSDDIAESYYHKALIFAQKKDVDNVIKSLEKAFTSAIFKSDRKFQEDVGCDSGFKPIKDDVKFREFARIHNIELYIDSM